MLLAISGGALSMCGTQKKVAYQIESHVTEENRVLFIERAEKGRILFREHCSGCHGVFAKAKDSVPDFTHHQIDNYNARAIAQSGSHTTARKLSGEQLDYIITRKPGRITIVITSIAPVKKSPTGSSGLTPGSYRRKAHMHNNWSYLFLTNRLAA